MRIEGNYQTYQGTLLAGILIVFLITPFVIRLAIRLGAVDQPGSRKVHLEPIPLLGGLSVFVGMWLPILLLSFWDNIVTRELRENAHQLIAVLGSGVAMLLLGFVDDKIGLRSRFKFLIQLILACGLVASGYYFNNLTIPFIGELALGVFGPITTIIWIVGITNAINLIDGIDGLATGVAFFVAATNTVIAIINGHELLAVLMCAMAGACLGFLYYNFNPAKIFLGDTGSLFIGMTLAVSALVASSKNTLAASMFAPVLVLGYPAMDTLLVMLRRGLKGKPLFAPGMDHLHHWMLALGLNQRKISLLLYGVCFVLCVLATGSVVSNWKWEGAAMIIFSAMVLFGLARLGYFKFLFSNNIIKERPLFQIAHHFSEMNKAKIFMAHDKEEVLKLLQQIKGPELGIKSIEIISRGIKDNKEENDELVERLNFDDTNLSYQINFLPNENTSDLLIEYKTLIVDLFKVANQQLNSFTGSVQEFDAEQQPTINPST